LATPLPTQRALHDDASITRADRGMVSLSPAGLGDRPARIRGIQLARETDAHFVRLDRDTHGDALAIEFRVRLTNASSTSSGETVSVAFGSSIQAGSSPGARLANGSK